VANDIVSTFRVSPFCLSANKKIHSNLSIADPSGRSRAGIAVSNPAGVSLVSVVCCQVNISMRGAYQSSWGFLPVVLFLSVIVKPWQ